MKHLFTLMTLCCGISAAAIPAHPLQARPLPDFKEIAGSIKAKAESGLHKSPQRAPEAPSEVITSAEGFQMKMDLVTSGFFVYQDVEYYEEMSSSSEIVLGDDGYFYFKDIMSMMPFDTYVRGEMDEETGKIVVSLPQTLAFEADDDGDLWVDLSLMYVEDPEMPFPMAVEGNNQITFTYNDDGSFTMDPLEDGYCIGLNMYPDDMWFGFSETAVAYKMPNDDNKPTTKPDGLQGKDYSYITYGFNEYDPSRSPDFGYRVDVAIDDEDNVYITGLSYDDPSICVGGKLAGDKIIIPNGQYIGNLSGVYTCKVALGKSDENAYGGYSLLPEDAVMTLNYDAEQGIIEEDGSDVVMFFNLTPNNNPNGIYFLQMYEGLKLVSQAEPSGAPAAPWGLTFEDTFEKAGFSIFDFNLPVLNEEGVVLDRSNMYYRIFLDDEIFEFDTADYSIPENMEDIPYLFYNNLIVSVKYGTAHEIGIKADGFDTIGVQSYNDYNGEVYAGSKATINIHTGDVVVSAISEVATESAVKDVKYYDLSGRQVSNPASGFFVKRSVLDNGNIMVEKVLKR